MNDKSIRIISLGAGLIVGGLGLLLVVLTLASLPNTAGLDDVMKNKKIMDTVDAFLNGFFYLTYLAILACAGLAIFFGVLKAAKNPAKAKGSLIGIVALALVFAIGWALADDTIYWVGKRPDEIAKLNEEISSTARRFSGMAVNAMYILMLLAVLSLLGGEVYRLVKTRR
ncbi:MAG: hypothetical protein N2110_01945 [Flavobacteriales bacterium]|nr:hypothetical protein [Flavobacteriales bacterium]MCX7767771.1 hypothetical protein [Flavobacteriales bacterium]MDW8410292.1 hypothetical protein [Flavobacteriales bacterium]